MRLRRGDGRDGKNVQRTPGHAKRDVEPECVRGRRTGSKSGESGQTTVVMTLFLATFLFGFIAIGIDVEALFHARRQAQAAADAAALAAAEESPQGNASEYTAAAAAAKQNGFDTGLAVNPAVVTINQIPTSGNYSTGATSGAYLEVIVSQPIRTFFAGLLTHKTTMVVAARAVAARDQTSPTCVCLVSPTGTDLTLDNGSNFNPTGCGTTVNSVGMDGTPAIPAVTVTGAVLGGSSIGTVDSKWDNPPLASGLIAAGTKVVMGLASGCNPPTPPMPTYNPALCTAEPTGGAWGNFDVGPYSPLGNTQSNGVICYNALTVGSNAATVNLEPGVYVIRNGSLHFLSGVNNRSNTGGNGVTFYLTGTASLTIDNGASVNLIAPTSGPYANYTIIQDPGDPLASPARTADTQSISIQGGANTSFKGAIFAPTANIAMGNGSAQTIGADVVGKTLHMYGGTTLNSTPMANLGSYNISTAKITE